MQVVDLVDLTSIQVTDINPEPVIPKPANPESPVFGYPRATSSSWIPELSLSLNHKSLLLSTQWLDDSVIAAGLKLLVQQFPQVGGLLNPLLLRVSGSCLKCGILKVSSSVVTIIEFHLYFLIFLFYYSLMFKSLICVMCTGFVFQTCFVSRVV